MKTYVCMLGCALMFLASCVTGSGAPVATGSPDAETGAVPQAGPSTDFVTILEGTNGKADEASIAIASDEKAFAKLWRGVNGFAVPVPPVDFSSRVVVAAFMGMKNTGGYRYAVESAAWLADGRFSLTLAANGPAKGASVTMALTSPFIMVSVPRSAAEPLVTVVQK